MRGKVGGLSPPYFKSRGAIAPLAPLLPPPLCNTNDCYLKIDNILIIKYMNIRGLQKLQILWETIND